MASAPVRAPMEVRHRVLRTSVVSSVEHVRRMRGGSQAHLMRCSRGEHYVVKFRNNPQHRRILVNELLGTRLAARLGLPTTPAAIVDVPRWLIDLTDDLVMELPKHRAPCSPGLQFGSRYFGNPGDNKTLDSLPSNELSSVKNLRDLIGMVVFDKWVCNCDGRQSVFLPDQSGKYLMACIDHGFCFNAGEWNFPDSPLRGVYWDKSIYRELSIRTLDDFEPWLSRLENEFSFTTLEDAARDIPPEWFEGDYVSLRRLLWRLNRRRRLVRELIRHSCESLPKIFPQWISTGERGSDGGTERIMAAGHWRASAGSFAS